MCQSATVQDMPSPVVPPETWKKSEDEWWAAIGANIHDAALRAGMTHGDLATAAGLSRPYVTRIINGKRRNANVLPRIANALKVEIDSLLPNPRGVQNDTAAARTNAGGRRMTDGEVVARDIDAISDASVRMRARNAALMAIEEALREPAADPTQPGAEHRASRVRRSK